MDYDLLKRTLSVATLLVVPDKVKAYKLDHYWLQLNIGGAGNLPVLIVKRMDFKWQSGGYFWRKHQASVYFPAIELHIRAKILKHSKVKSLKICNEKHTSRSR